MEPSSSVAQFCTAERRRWERRALGKDHPKPSRDLNNHLELTVSSYKSRGTKGRVWSYYLVRNALTLKWRHPWRPSRRTQMYCDDQKYDCVRRLLEALINRFWNIPTPFVRKCPRAQLLFFLSNNVALSCLMVPLRRSSVLMWEI